MSNFGSLPFSEGAFVAGEVTGSLESVRNLVRPSLASFVDLMQDVLCRSTCFRCVEMADERDDVGLGIRSPSTSHAGMGRDLTACMPGVMAGEGADMGFSWSTPFELDFL
jgi:hypothetical protein